MQKAVLKCTSLLIVAAGLTSAQQSPPAQATVTIGGKKLTINYSAPSVRGRKIFIPGGVISHDSTYPVWRAGANEATAFHTDADLPAARIAADPQALLARASEAGELAQVLAECEFTPHRSGFTAAHTMATDPCAGDAWLAAGDAALSFDPLSAQGLLNAMFTGLAAAEAADRHLSGGHDAVPGYVETVARIHLAYCRHLSFWYRAETRWPAAPFWQRRHQANFSRCA